MACRLKDGRYYSRDGVDDGYYRDENGRERDLPEGWRVVVRLLNGQILMVVKGSIWNGSSATYSGGHDALNANMIRGAIERAIARQSNAVISGTEAAWFGVFLSNIVSRIRMTPERRRYGEGRTR